MQDQRSTKANTAHDGITVSDFGVLPDGRPVSLYTITNRNKVEMKVMNYGGIIVSLKTPDKNGKFDDVVLGYDSLASYVENNPFFGALIGRYGNRIAKGKFTLNGQQYSLPVNNGLNHLHGGPVGFFAVYWDIEIVSPSTLKLSYVAKDGEQGYPGNLSTVILYKLTDDNQLVIQYSATTDMPTVVNLTQHTYFNLAAEKGADILGHKLVLKADAFLPVDPTLIPTGERRAVKGTPFDFLESKSIGAQIRNDDEQLAIGNGYDHCWILNDYDGTMREVAVLSEPVSGRRVRVLTTEPGIQFYSGNFLDGSLIGKGGVAYQFRSGLCLETQHFPDSPNRPEFPSVILNPGETYSTTTVYKFEN